MTVSSTTNRKDYVAGGPTLSFDFKILAETDLLVIDLDTVSGAQTPLVLGTDYTVSGAGDEGGGSITLLAGAIVTNHKTSIIRHMELVQPTDVKNQGDYLASLHEDEFDRLLMQIQQMAEESSRSLKLPASEVPDPLTTTIPSLIARAGYTFGWDSQGRPVALASTTTVPAITLASFFVTWLASTLPNWLIAFLSGTTSTDGLTALGIASYWRTRLISNPAAFMQTFLSASTAAAARAALGFGATLKFIVGGDIADGTITVAKLAFSFATISGMTRKLSVFNTSTHQLSVLADSLKIQEWEIASVTQAADMDVNGTGGLEFTTPGGTTPSTELASHWYSIWVICKSDGTAVTTILSASLTAPIMPSGYVGTAGRKVRVGVVYNNASMNFENFRIDDDWFTHLRTSAHKTFNGGASWDGSVTIGSMANTAKLIPVNPQSVPAIETEVDVYSSVYTAPPSSGALQWEIGFGRPSSGSPVVPPSYASGGRAYSFATASNYFSVQGVANARIRQDVNGNIAAEAILGSWAYPSWTMWVTGFRIPSY